MALQPKWDARPPAAARPPPSTRRTDNFSKSDNNTLRQILAEGKKDGYQRSTVKYSQKIDLGAMLYTVVPCGTLG